MKAVIHAAREENASNIVYLSHTQHNKTDPLDYDFKAEICKKAFPLVNISKDNSIKTPFQALEALSKNYDKAILIVGSDQVSEFTERMMPYAKEWGIELDVKSAGLRNNSGKVNGVSASKMRKYAQQGKLEEFFKWCPTLLSDKDKKELFRRVFRSLRISE